jgi:hypothetical protein
MRRGILKISSIALAATVVASFLLFQPARPFILCAYGSSEYAGTVVDQSGKPVSGVVVLLSSEHPWESFVEETVTNESGAWSLKLKACSHDARFYWKSSQNGPVLKEVVNIPLRTEYTLPVWRQPQTVKLVSQYPNAIGVNVSYNITVDLRMSIGALYNGNFSVGFLGLNDAGEVGTDIVVKTSYNDNGKVPWTVFMTVGTAYRIVDTGGNSLIYLEEAPILEFYRAPDDEYLAMQEAIEQMQKEGHISLHPDCGQSCLNVHTQHYHVGSRRSSSEHHSECKWHRSRPTSSATPRQLPDSECRS